MQYTPHYNLNLPEGTDIVNPLVQDNPNYSAIDTALYNNKLRVIGSANHVKAGTDHAITLGDSDINQFKFVATGDYVSGDTFSVDGVTVTPRLSDGSSIPNGAFKINSTVLCILDGTVLNLVNVDSVDATSLQNDLNTINSRLSGIENQIETHVLTFTLPSAIDTWSAQVALPTGWSAADTHIIAAKVQTGTNVWIGVNHDDLNAISTLLESGGISVATHDTYCLNKTVKVVIQKFS